MLLNPAILALVGASVVVSLLLLLAAVFAWQVLRHWDINSGSERQLVLERRTYLISTLVALAFAAQLVSLLLFIYNAEALSGQFVGAMCATGVLNVNAWGWPTLYLKIALFFAGAVWLMLNRLDNHGYDYPLVRVKYALLLAIVPLVLAEAVAQLTYFLSLDPDVITSCCGSLFSPEGQGVAAEVAGVAPRTAMTALVAAAVATLASGLWYLWRRRGALLYAVSAAVSFPLALVAVVSCIALYVYEHPHHHCPFCVLKSGYDFVGYWLYLPLFGATAFALGAGVLTPWRGIESLRAAAAGEIRHYTQISLLLFAAFYAVTAWVIAHSNLSMAGVWW